MRFEKLLHKNKTGAIFASQCSYANETCWIDNSVRKSRDSKQWMNDDEDDDDDDDVRNIWDLSGRTFTVARVRKVSGRSLLLRRNGSVLSAFLLVHYWLSEHVLHYQVRSDQITHLLKIQKETTENEDRKTW